MPWCLLRFLQFQAQQALCLPMRHYSVHPERWAINKEKDMESLAGTLLTQFAYTDCTGDDGCWADCACSRFVIQSYL